MTVMSLRLLGHSLDIFFYIIPNFYLECVGTLIFNRLILLYFRPMAGSSQTLSHEDVVSNVPREASSSLYSKLLEEQQAIYPDPIRDYWHQHHPNGPKSLLL